MIGFVNKKVAPIYAGRPNRTNIAATIDDFVCDGVDKRAVILIKTSSAKARRECKEITSSQKYETEADFHTIPLLGLVIPYTLSVVLDLKPFQILTVCKNRKLRQGGRFWPTR